MMDYQDGLKAYWVRESNDAEWGMFIHATTAGKAKSIFLRGYPGDVNPDWTDIRARRCRGYELLDIVPFTDYSLRLAGYLIPMDDQDHIPNCFLDDCPCDMCRKEKERGPIKLSTDLGMGGAETVDLTLIPVEKG